MNKLHNTIQNVSVGHIEILKAHYFSKHSSVTWTNGGRQWVICPNSYQNITRSIRSRIDIFYMHSMTIPDQPIHYAAMILHNYSRMDLSVPGCIPPPEASAFCKLSGSH